MKAFKINSHAAIAVITSSLSLGAKPKVSKKERREIVEALQAVIFSNKAKYGVHVLETDNFLFAGLSHIKNLEQEGDVQFIEEVEVEITKTPAQDRVFEAVQNFQKFMAEIRDKGLGDRSTIEPGASKSSKEENCDCPICQLRKSFEKKLENLSKKN